MTAESESSVETIDPQFLGAPEGPLDLAAPQQPVEATPPEPAAEASESPFQSEEVEAIDPAPKPGDTFTLSTGSKVRVVPLRAKQFFALLRIVTRGVAQSGFGQMFQLRPDMEQGEFISQLLAMVLVAIPEAEDEAFDFIRAMLVPAEGEPSRERMQALAAEIEEIGLDDVVSIIEVVVRREGADMQALGKRLSALMGLAEKTGQLKGTPLSEASPGPST